MAPRKASNEFDDKVAAEIASENGDEEEVAPPTREERICTIMQDAVPKGRALLLAGERILNMDELIDVDAYNDLGLTYPEMRWMVKGIFDGIQASFKRAEGYKVKRQEGWPASEAPKFDKWMEGDEAGLITEMASAAALEWRGHQNRQGEGYLPLLFFPRTAEEQRPWVMLHLSRGATPAGHAYLTHRRHVDEADVLREEDKALLHAKRDEAVVDQATPDELDSVTDIYLGAMTEERAIDYLQTRLEARLADGIEGPEAEA